MSAVKSVSDGDQTETGTQGSFCLGPYSLLAVVLALFAALALTALTCEPFDQDQAAVPETEAVFGLAVFLESAEETVAGPAFLWCPLFTAGVIAYDDVLQRPRLRAAGVQQGTADGRAAD